MDALKRQRVPTPLGPLFAPARDEAAEVELDKVAVLFPLPLPEPFDYRAPSAMGLKPGCHVIAPIGSRLVRGVVWTVEQNNPGAANLKAIAEILPGPPLPEISRLFVDWAAKYLVRPPGDILRMVARSPEALLPPPTYIVLAPTGETPAKMNDARARILGEAAKEHVSAAELARRAGASSAVVKGLVDCGALAKLEISEDPPFGEPMLFRPPFTGEVSPQATEGVGRGARAGNDATSWTAGVPAGETPAVQGRGGARMLSDIQRAAADDV